MRGVCVVWGKSRLMTSEMGQSKGAGENGTPAMRMVCSCPIPGADSVGGVTQYALYTVMDGHPVYTTSLLRYLPRGPLQAPKRVILYTVWRARWPGTKNIERS